MIGWSDKNFRLLEPIRQKFEELMGRKGQQMYAGSAALRWYTQATPGEREAYEQRVREVEKELGNIHDPVVIPQTQIDWEGGVDPWDVAMFARRVFGVVDDRLKELEKEMPSLKPRGADRKKIAEMLQQFDKLMETAKVLVDEETGVNRESEKQARQRIAAEEVLKAAAKKPSTRRHRKEP